MDTTTLAIWILLIIGLCIIGIFVALAVWRKIRAFNLHVMKDYRNPGKAVQKFYVIKDIKTKSLDYYSNLLTPWATRHVPLYDIGAYADANKVVKVIRSPTGRAGDDMDVPIGVSLNSQAAAGDYAKMLSDAVTNMMQFFDICKKEDFRIGEIVEWEPAQPPAPVASSVMSMVNGAWQRNEPAVPVQNKFTAKIIAITYDGITIEYSNPAYDVNIAGSKKYLAHKVPSADYTELAHTMKSKDKLALEPLGYSDFFTERFVMEKFGIRKVEDASVITIPQKTAIASLSSRANEFIMDRAGFLEKHASLLVGLMILLFAGLTAIFVFYGANTFYAGITGDIASLVPAGAHLAGQPTTTIAANGQGVLNASSLIVQGKG